MEGEQFLYTVGHSNHTLEVFLGLLRQYEIEALVDTRSAPRSGFAPHFNRDVLRYDVERAGMRYVFLGGELGGRPDGDEFYDDEGHVLYDRVAESESFLKAVAKLERARERYRTAIFCAEEDPSACHRRLLVSRVLAARGVPVAHIRGDGRVQTEAELCEAETGGQGALFGAEEVRAWRSVRSIRSASPKRTPPGFSGF